jgi:hypothetical protein
MSLEIRLSVEAFTTTLPIALERASIGFILDQLHDVHSEPRRWGGFDIRRHQGKVLTK